MKRTKGTRVIWLFIYLLGLVLSGSPVSAQVAGPTASPQESSAKPMRIRVAANVPRATSQTPPVYPQSAIDQHVEGNVVLHVIIGADGAVKESSAMSGPTLLFQSAVEAVRQWQYQPFRLNGSPIEQDTTVTLNFILGPPPTVAVNNQPLSAFSPEASALRRQQRPPLPAVDPDTAADIRQLLEATGMRNVVTALFGSPLLGIRAQLLKDLPASVDREKVANRFQDELQKRIASRPGTGHRDSDLRETLHTPRRSNPFLRFINRRPGKVRPGSAVPDVGSQRCGCSILDEHCHS